ncbi:MAG: hypothetical protein JWM74_1523 [Myxococcaceae bacterium]|nr:hypothetical protein [Myxococcaceae bacterium]
MDCAVDRGSRSYPHAMRLAGWRSAVASVVVIAALVTTLACSSDGGAVDNCGGGSNMSSPRLVSGVETDRGARFLRITWDRGTGRGAELSRNYFESVRLGDSTGVPEATEAALTSDREIRVELAAAPRASTIAFVLVFDDRRQYVSCSHPGMSDSYFLDVSVVIDANGVATSSTLVEGVSLGAI